MTTTSPPLLDVANIKESAQYKQVMVFLGTLGIKKKLGVVVCGDLLYINMEILVPILDVTPDWMIRNSEVTTYYIMYKNRVYVNRYGLMRLLSQSKQAVAFKIQDYFMELMYHVETKGQVSIEDVQSRARLSEYIENAGTLLDTITKKSDTLAMEKEALIDELRAAQERNDSLMEELTVALHTNQEYQDIAARLVKYVRKIPNKITDELANAIDASGIDDYISDGDDNSPETLAFMQTQAYAAKQKHAALVKEATASHRDGTAKASTKAAGKAAKATKDTTTPTTTSAATMTTKPSAKKKPQQNTATHSLLRSKFQEWNSEYEWKLVTRVTDEFRQSSTAWLESYSTQYDDVPDDLLDIVKDTTTVTKHSDPYVWIMDMVLDNPRLVALDTVLKKINKHTEIEIENLIRALV